MAYNEKTDWKSTDNFTHTAANKIEQGIADAHVLLAQQATAISNLQNRMILMESTLPENFVYNRFDFDFTTINGIKIINGRYNAAATRLEV